MIIIAIKLSTSIFNHTTTTTTTVLTEYSTYSTSTTKNTIGMYKSKHMINENSVERCGHIIKVFIPHKVHR